MRRCLLHLRISTRPRGCWPISASTQASCVRNRPPAIRAARARMAPCAWVSWRLTRLARMCTRRMGKAYSGRTRTSRYTSRAATRHLRCRQLRGPIAAQVPPGPTESRARSLLADGVLPHFASRRPHGPVAFAKRPRQAVAVARSLQPRSTRLASPCPQWAGSTRAPPTRSRARLDGTARAARHGEPWGKCSGTGRRTPQTRSLKPRNSHPSDTLPNDQRQRRRRQQNTPRAALRRAPRGPLLARTAVLQRSRSRRPSELQPRVGRGPAQGGRRRWPSPSDSSCLESGPGVQGGHWAVTAWPALRHRAPSFLLPPLHPSPSASHFCQPPPCARVISV
mmetsp:Transcript_57288/g.153057  ORF Transcript_57288/g.153057 Transcript_57288/m.153057 type:complete len:337 (-) Transcript_57288:81-1091(-)